MNSSSLVYIPCTIKIVHEYNTREEKDIAAAVQLEGSPGDRDACPFEKYALKSVNHFKINECFTC